MMKTRTLVSAALFAALTAVLSQISIPLPGLVPLSLGTLAVYLSGALLGPKWGAISQLVYLGLGFVGLPVFSAMRAGPGVLAGPTGGYLVGYVVLALLSGLLLTVKPAKWMLPVSMAAGTAVLYTLGTAWYMFSTASGLLPALTACVLPFLIGDALKIVAATLIAMRVGILRMSGKSAFAA